MNNTYRFLMILSIGVFLDPTGLPAIARADEVPSVEEILQMEKQMIEARKGISSGRVVVRTRLTKFPQNPSQENVTKRYETYLEGDNIRSDFSVGEYRSQMIVTPDTLTRNFSNQKSVDVFGPETRPKTSSGVPDPRRLGIVLWFYDTISGHGYEDIFLNPNRDQFKVEAGTDAGEPIWKVSFRMSGGRPRAVLGEYWLCESKGGLPVYIAFHARGGERPSSSSTIKVKLKEYGSGSVWFPSEVIFLRTRGGEVASEEVTTVEEAVFGEDIPDETFQIAGMGLPKGKIIDFDGKLATWDGQRVVRQDEPWVNDAPPATGRLWLTAISIVLAVVAALLLWLRGRNKGAA